MRAKATMSLAMPAAEMKVLEQLAEKRGTSKSEVLRHALRLCQLVTHRQDNGWRLTFVGQNGAVLAELQMLPAPKQPEGSDK